MNKIVSTGSIIPLGDGLTGKTVLTNLLIRDEITTEELQRLHDNINKSLNIEMEFYADTIRSNGKTIEASLQYYVFPGQRQRFKDIAPTFDEILEVFEFLPAIQNISVLLLVHDCSRIESLKSLESWLIVALDKGWISRNTSIVLVSNKIDLQPANEDFVEDVLNGIFTMVTEYVEDYDRDSIVSFDTSCVDYTGIDDLRDHIISWIGHNGKKLGQQSTIKN